MKTKSDSVKAQETKKKSVYAFEIASREDLQTLIVEAGRPLTHQQVAQALAIYDEDERFIALGRRLNAMVRDAQLVRNRRGGYLGIDRQGLVSGRISAHPDGFGFLVREQPGDDVYLDERQMRKVLDGDKALVQLIGTDKRGRSYGAVVEVEEKAREPVVGRIRTVHGRQVLTADNKRLYRDFTLADGVDAAHGQVVLADVVESPTATAAAVARVTAVLGEHMAAGMEIDIALRSHGIPSEWPPAVLQQCKQFGEQIEPAAVADRRDIRQLALVTIDGEDARDFDDAVFAERRDTGWRLLVAIADVSHYVSSGNDLDNEALRRGTSVYFPQRVVPMLPELLSNGLCSLNPLVDRLCMVCDMSIDHSGSIRRSRFYPATMRSAARLTYTRVGHYLDGDVEQLDVELQPRVDCLAEVYAALAVAREERGVIDFDTNETRVVLGEDGKITGLEPVRRNNAHRLIEECMIAANIAAARFLERHGMPGPFRVHEQPAGDKLNDLRKFLQQRGLSLGGGEKPAPLDFAQTLKQAAGRADISVIQTVMLRSLTQAIYSVGNKGHFGLALTQYAHFTSPIRRYPDLMVHRAIRHVLTHKSNQGFVYSGEHAANIAEQCSTTERRAEQAERDVLAWLKCEYMQDKVGTEHSGVISAVTAFGLFVQLDDIGVEGLVHVSSLPRDYFEFDSVRQCLTGRRGGQRFELGQLTFVSVAAVHLDERKIDLQLVSGDGSVVDLPGSGRSAAAPPKKGRNKAGKNKANEPKKNRKRQKRRG